MANTIRAHDRKAPDPEKVDAFAERLLGMLNESALALMTSIGHRTGLFDVLARQPASTSESVAREAGLHERYVREWLAAMTVGRFVTYDAATQTYALPPEHAAALTRAATPDNVAVFAQYVPLLGQSEDDVIACFRDGGGVPYARFPRFHDIMAEDSGQTVVAALDESILPLVPGLQGRLAKGIDVLDVGCGRGLALMKMAAAYPESRFTGLDVSQEAIDSARASADASGLTNVTFVVQDAAAFSARDAFDFVTTFDAVHDQKDPARVLATIARALREGGTYLMQDIAASSRLEENLDHSIGPFLYTLSCMHCMTVSLAEDGAGLGTMWGEERALAMLEDAGFRRVEIHKLSHDFQNAFFVARKR